MSTHPVDLDNQKQGKTWLLPPYSYSLIQIASELDVGIGTVQKWRQQLVDSGHQFESNKIEDNNFSAEQKFAAVIEIALAIASEKRNVGYRKITQRV